MLEYHDRSHDNLMRKLEREHLNLARVCFLLGIIFGVVLGAISMWKFQ